MEKTIITNSAIFEKEESGHAKRFFFLDLGIQLYYTDHLESLHRRDSVLLRTKMKKIKIAIIGVGNCASSLVQGIEFYRRQNSSNGHRDALGLMNYEIGGYR